MGYEDAINRFSEYTKVQQRGGEGSQKLRYPLLSVYVGKEAVRCREKAESVYRKGWPLVSDTLVSHAAERLERGVISEKAIDTLRQRYSQIDKRNGLFLAIYWDISDENFDDNFAAVKENLTGVPVTYAVRKVIFVFTASTNHAYEERIKALTEWAENDNEHLFLLTDRSNGELFSFKWMEENVTLAADIVLLANSTPLRGEAEELGWELTQKGNNLFSVGYHSEGKKNREIAAVTMARILQVYKSAATNIHGDVANLEGYFGGYQQHFEQVFNTVFLPLFPSDSKFFNFLPRTEAMERFEESFQNTFEVIQKRGLFSTTRQMVQNTNTDAGRLGRIAKDSVSSFWQAIREFYYEEPIEKIWLEHGESEISKALVRPLANALGYEQLASKALLQEADALEERAVTFTEESLPLLQANSAEGWLSISMKREIKMEWYPKFYRILAGEMRKMHKNAASFGDLIDEVIRQLRNYVTDESILGAYNLLTDEACTTRRNYLLQTIRPCNNEEELLAMLEDVYKVIVQERDEYHYSFINELEWRSQRLRQPLDINDMVRGDAYDAEARVPTYTDPIVMKKYIIMRSVDQGIVNAPDYKIFDLPVSGKIEKLIIYKVPRNNLAFD